MRGAFLTARTAVLLGLACTAACRGGCGAADTPTEQAAKPPSSASPVAPSPPPLEQDPLEPELPGAGQPKVETRFQALTLQRGFRKECVELRPARAGDDPKDPTFRSWNPGSEGLGVAAIMFFHPAFAKAHRGFDLTSPRLLAPAELLVLADALSETSLALLAATDLAAAKARWGKVPLVAEMERDDDWRAARPLLAQSAQGLATRAKALAAAKEGLWVLAF